MNETQHSPLAANTTLDVWLAVGIAYASWKGEGTEQEAVKMLISRQAAELNKLRQDCARLVNELGEKNSKLQQEELQKKNAEQAVAQLKVTLLFSA